MDLDDTQTLVVLLSGLAILVGLIGVIVPILPGLLLCCSAGPAYPTGRCWSAASWAWSASSSSRYSAW
ncbi:MULTISPECIES: hypothetical protein [unclassified Micromonospora]|uniref:hypothetical protein n=1 Tax=unclassified Micromonospora TaxID=2617518 RepID=UPI003A895FFB